MFAIRRYRALKEIHRKSLSLSAGLRARHNEAGAYDNPVASEKLSEFFRAVRANQKVLGQFRMLRILQHQTDPMMRNAMFQASQRQQHVAQVEAITENTEYELAAILKMWETWLIILSVVASSLSGTAWIIYVLFRVP